MIPAALSNLIHGEIGFRQQGGGLLQPQVLDNLRIALPGITAQKSLKVTAAVSEGRGKALQ